MRDADFERLYAEHAEALFAFLAYRTGDRVLAEDLLADTFERVLRARRRFDRRRGSAKTWIYAIALNLLRDHARRRTTEARALERTHSVAVAGEGESAPERALEGVEHRDTVGQALAGLSDEEREAIALRFGGDLTNPEIAKVTGERLTTVEGRVYRALGKLRDGLS